MKRFLLVPLIAAALPALANDVDPFGFEKQVSDSTLTRAEVTAKMKAPQTVTMRIDDQGRLITTPSTRSRAEVVAETVAAAKMGLMRYGELGPVEPTLAQQETIRLAGQRAHEQGAIE